MRTPPGDAFRAIGNFVGGNPEEPSRKRHPTPFKPRQTFQREMKHVGGDILRFVAIAHPPHDVGINALEVSLIQVGEPAPVALRRLDKRPLRRVVGVNLRRRPRLQLTLQRIRAPVSRAADRAYSDATRADT